MLLFQVDHDRDTALDELLKVFRTEMNGKLPVVFGYPVNFCLVEMKLMGELNDFFEQVFQ